MATPEKEKSKLPARKAQTKNMDSIRHSSAPKKPAASLNNKTHENAEKTFHEMDNDAVSIDAGFVHSAMPIEPPTLDTPQPTQTDGLNLLKDIPVAKNNMPLSAISPESTSGSGNIFSRFGNGIRGLTWKKWLLVCVSVLFAGGVAAAGYAYYVTTHSITDKENQTGFFGQLQRIVDKNVEPLRGEKEDRINVLLMGKGGEGHDGGGLVDTVIVASIQPSTNKVALISLPRDLVVPHYPKGQKYPNYERVNKTVILGGTDFAKESMKTVLGLDIQYVVEADFSGFRSVVDTIDGVDINVENGFTGYYGADELSEPCPRANLANLEDGAYCAITFTAGEEHMDGERALQYARIRKMSPRSENPDEGTDFKRAARQQLVLQAIKDKVLSLGTLANPIRISNLLNDLGDHISTDMEIWEMARFAEIAQKIDRANIKNIVIDQGENGLVHRDPETVAYVLVPNAGVGDYSEIQNVALNVFNESAVASENTKQTLAAEKAVVILQNGSTTEGLASRTATTLSTAGISVASYSNAAKKDVTTTLLFDLTGSNQNNKSATRAALEQQFGVTATPTTLNKGNTNVTIGGSVDTSSIALTEIPVNTDFVVILGSDVAAKKTSTQATQTNTNSSGNTNAGSTNSNSTGSVRIVPTNTNQ